MQRQCAKCTWSPDLLLIDSTHRQSMPQNALHSQHVAQQPFPEGFGGRYVCVYVIYVDRIELGQNGQMRACW